MVIFPPAVRQSNCHKHRRLHQPCQHETFAGVPRLLAPVGRGDEILIGFCPVRGPSLCRASAMEFAHLATGEQLPGRIALSALGAMMQRETLLKLHGGARAPSATSPRMSLHERVTSRWFAAAALGAPYRSWSLGVLDGVRPRSGRRGFRHQPGRPHGAPKSVRAVRGSVGANRAGRKPHGRH